MILKNNKFNLCIVIFLVVALIAGAVGAASAIEMPAQFYGTVQDQNGSPVAWEQITATMNVGSGVVRNDSLYPDSAGDYYRDGQYGMLDGALTPEVPRLCVTCPEGSNCAGKVITFKVTSGGVTYTATTSPATVTWAADLKQQVNLTVNIAPPPPGVSGNVKLEKINPDDPEPDHAGIMVKVKQGAVTRTTYANSNGNYSLNDAALAAGNCTVEFDYLDGPWKKETRQVTLPASGSAQLADVTLLIGDMDSNGLINIRDLLFVASNIDQEAQSEYADVNYDGSVNILDLLRVKQNVI